LSTYFGFFLFIFSFFPVPSHGKNKNDYNEKFLRGGPGAPWHGGPIGLRPLKASLTELMRL